MAKTYFRIRNHYCTLILNNTKQKYKLSLTLPSNPQWTTPVLPVLPNLRISPDLETDSIDWLRSGFTERSSLSAVLRIWSCLSRHYLFINSWQLFSDPWILDWVINPNLYSPIDSIFILHKDEMSAFVSHNWCRYFAYLCCSDCVLVVS